MDLVRPDKHTLCKILVQELEVLGPTSLERLKVEIALDVAYEGHRNAPERTSGEAFIFHPFRAAIANIRQQAALGVKDIALVEVILIHDCFEDAEKGGKSPLLMRSEILIRMGDEIASDVHTLTKHSERGETRASYNTRLLASTSWRPLAAKFEDREDNVDTIEWMPRPNQISKVFETEQWFPHFGERLLALIEVEIVANRLSPQFRELPRILLQRLMRSVLREKTRIGMP